MTTLSRASESFNRFLRLGIPSGRTQAVSSSLTGARTCLRIPPLSVTTQPRLDENPRRTYAKSTSTPDQTLFDFRSKHGCLTAGVDDIFAHFAEKAKAATLPSFEDLEAAAKRLYRAYCTQHAAERALEDVHDLDTDAEHPKRSAWKAAVPLGSPWKATGSTPQPDTSTSTQREQAGQPSTPMPPCTSAPSSAKNASKTARERFEGDRSLANTISFMIDALALEEFHYAVAEGDVGRVYEVIKVMVFTFAGSPHSKYTSYLLEFICTLELESSQELRNAVLQSTLINLSGDAGRFSPADLIQEYFNRLLQAIAERKGAEYNNHFLRNVVSRNLHHLARLCNDLKSGIGLTARSGRHAAPHLRSELRILLEEFKLTEVHRRRPGRSYIDGDALARGTDFRRGLSNLRAGRLERWIRESTYMRGSSARASGTRGSDDSGDSEIQDQDDADEAATEDAAAANAGLEDDVPPSIPVLPSFIIQDGVLVSRPLNILGDAEDILQDLSRYGHVEHGRSSTMPGEHAEEEGMSSEEEGYWDDD
ncbi:hypothetical protein NUW54_g11617 [Trametes sanguinea]|uniref:Uncharacterized protein n=1 Tax=Trametes sanguinea TaxID=158606 RepID=A0ACC1NAZ3_9APHY|nr:hypothetical protein NUW54_g11617 [Trametes sanguinea]